MLGGLTFKPLTPQTITSKAALKKDIQASQARGWFLNREESVEDSLTVSARFKWYDAMYIITVAGSVKRMERKLDAVARALKAAAADLEMTSVGAGAAP
jgi:DNA-binding IclR family transcriptional regulator